MCSAVSKPCFSLWATGFEAIQPRVAQRHFHATRRAFAFRRGRRHMAGVGRVAVADDFAINFRAARLRVFQILQQRESPRLRPSQSRRVPCRTAARHAADRRCACSSRASRKTRRCPWARSVASVPPAKIACASPILMVRQASPMACVEVAQAEQVAKFGPRKP